VINKINTFQKDDLVAFIGPGRDFPGRVNPNSVPTYLYVIQAFLEINDIEINWKKIRRPDLIL